MESLLTTITNQEHRIIALENILTKQTKEVAELQDKIFKLEEDIAQR
jgi:uncharacterized coiled-coil protein SlyX